MLLGRCFFFFKQKTAYELRISDWSSDVCSSDLYPAMTGGVGLDLQRVEVLKGPQGTLFGQNSTAGAINYIANKPTDTFSAGVSGSFGRFDWWDARGFVSGPISDTLSIRIAAAHGEQIGRAHVGTPVINSHSGWRPLREKKNEKT